MVVTVDASQIVLHVGKTTEDIDQAIQYLKSEKEAILTADKKPKTKHVYVLEFERYQANSDMDDWYKRKFYCDGKLEYSDRITEEMYIHSLDYPDLFRMAEMFSMGFISVGCKSVDGKDCIWEMRDGDELKKRPRARELSELLDKRALERKKTD